MSDVIDLTQRRDAIHAAAKEKRDEEAVELYHRGLFELAEACEDIPDFQATVHASYVEIHNELARVGEKMLYAADLMNKLPFGTATAIRDLLRRYHNNTATTVRIFGDELQALLDNLAAPPAEEPQP